MRIAITGVGGFVGHHLSVRLASSGHEIHGCVNHVQPSDDTLDVARIRRVDVTDAAALAIWIADVQPDVVFHLAAQASVHASFEAGNSTHDVNLEGTRNLLDAVKYGRRSCRVIWVGSGEVYGNAGSAPIRETQPLAPLSPYACSKAAADCLVAESVARDRLDVVRLRPFNHIGPGQSRRFAIADFAAQIAGAAANREICTLQVGNLDAVRDFTDVRDVVRAYESVMSAAAGGAVFNVASGIARRLRDVVDDLIRLSDTEVQMVSDPDRVRPVEVPVLIGDASKLREATGWSPLFAWEQTLQDILADARRRHAQLS